MLRERTPVPIEKKAGWAPEPVWQFVKKQKNLLLLLGIISQIVHYTLVRHKVTLRNYIKSEPIKM